MFGVSTASYAGTQLVQLVQNGTFSQITTPGGASYEIDSASGTSTDVTGWTSAGYNFIFTPNEATSTAANGGAYSPQYNNYLTLFGAANGGAAGNTWNGNSPIYNAVTNPNVNFFGADGDYQTGAITQSISGLTAGQFYLLTFNWAGAQQHGFNGITTEGWTVCLGATCGSTPTLTNASNGFTGWQTGGIAFKASAATETLSFLAVGTPLGEPPFSLLDNVSLELDLPEPADLSVLAVGIAAVMAARRHMRRRAATV
jgi:hypothetical protein